MARRWSCARWRSGSVDTCCCKTSTCGGVQPQHTDTAHRHSTHTQHMDTAFSHSTRHTAHGTRYGAQPQPEGTQPHPRRHSHSTPSQHTSRHTQHTQHTQHSHSTHSTRHTVATQSPSQSQPLHTVTAQPLVALKGQACGRMWRQGSDVVQGGVCLAVCLVVCLGGGGGIRGGSDPVDELADGDPGRIACGDVSGLLGLELRVALRHLLELCLVVVRVCVYVCCFCCCCCFQG